MGIRRIRRARYTPMTLLGPAGGNVREDAARESTIPHVLILNELNLRRVSCAVGNPLVQGTLKGLCFQEVTIFMASHRTVPSVTPRRSRRRRRNDDFR